MTIREYKGSFEGLKLCFIGDGNNMANSLIVGGIKMGMAVSVACPDGYQPDAGGAGLGRAEPASFTCTATIRGRPPQAPTCSITDVWASMGQEGEAAERRKPVRRLSDQRRRSCAPPKPDAMVLHCLPAHRGEEITAEVFEAHADEIFDEAENRLHAQKAVMVQLMKDKA